MYKLRATLGPGVVVLRHERWGEQVWTLTKMRKHRDRACAICKQAVGDRAFRPLTNRGNRVERICPQHEATGMW